MRSQRLKASNLAVPGGASSKVASAEKRKTRRSALDLSSTSFGAAAVPARGPLERGAPRPAPIPQRQLYDEAPASSGTVTERRGAAAKLDQLSARLDQLHQQATRTPAPPELLAKTRQLFEKLEAAWPGQGLETISEELHKAEQIARDFTNIRDPDLLERRGTTPGAALSLLSQFADSFGALSPEQLRKIVAAADFELREIFLPNLTGTHLDQSGHPWMKLQIARWLAGEHAGIRTAAQLREVIGAHDFSGWDFIDVDNICGKLSTELYLELVKLGIFTSKETGRTRGGVGHAYNVFYPRDGGPEVLLDASMFQFLAAKGVANQVVVGSREELAALGERHSGKLRLPSGTGAMTPERFAGLYQSSSANAGWQGDVRELIRSIQEKLDSRG